MNLRLMVIEEVEMVVERKRVDIGMDDVSVVVVDDLLFGRVKDPYVVEKYCSSGKRDKQMMPMMTLEMVNCQEWA